MALEVNHSGFRAQYNDLKARTWSMNIWKRQFRKNWERGKKTSAFMCVEKNKEMSPRIIISPKFNKKILTQ